MIVCALFAQSIVFNLFAQSYVCVCVWVYVSHYHNANAHNYSKYYMVFIQMHATINCACFINKIQSAKHVFECVALRCSTKCKWKRTEIKTHTNKVCSHSNTMNLANHQVTDSIQRTIYRLPHSYTFQQNHHRFNCAM